MNIVVYHGVDSSGNDKYHIQVEDKYKRFIAGNVDPDTTTEAKLDTIEVKYATTAETKYADTTVEAGLSSTCYAKYPIANVYHLMLFSNMMAPNNWTEQHTDIAKCLKEFNVFDISQVDVSLNYFRRMFYTDNTDNTDNQDTPMPRCHCGIPMRPLRSWSGYIKLCCAVVGDSNCKMNVFHPLSNKYKRWYEIEKYYPIYKKRFYWLYFLVERWRRYPSKNCFCCGMPMDASQRVHFDYVGSCNLCKTCLVEKYHTFVKHIKRDYRTMCLRNSQDWAPFTWSPMPYTNVDLKYAEPY